MACREVSTWITENVLMPVEQVVTEAREACENVATWVEEEVRQPVEEWISTTERRCRVPSRAAQLKRPGFICHGWPVPQLPRQSGLGTVRG
jgi:hypothetical protein